jgi:hypothetical protein
VWISPKRILSILLLLFGSKWCGVCGTQ